MTSLLKVDCTHHIQITDKQTLDVPSSKFPTLHRDPHKNDQVQVIESMI